MKIPVALGIFVFASSANFAAVAHDVKAVASPRFPLESRISSEDVAEILNKPVDDDSRYVYQAAIRWTPGRELKGCFINGSPEKMALVEKAKDEMLSGTNVNIAIGFRDGDVFRICKSNDKGLYSEDVRIEFDGNDGCAAELGTVAKRTKPYSNGYIVAQNPSVYLGSGCLGSVTIKHELLHALGFHHEHQKPKNPCKFRYDVIASKYNWDEATVKNNFDELKSSNAYVASKGFDEGSVMRYDFSQDFLATPDCVGSPSSDLTDKDWDGLRSAYPMTFKDAQHKSKIAKRASVPSTGNNIFDDLVASVGDY